MDKRDYLNKLKTLDLRPEKIKIKESEPVVLMEQGNDGEQDLHAEIKKWFMKNPNPKDSQVREFAKKLGISEDKLEEHIYKILTKFLRKSEVTEYAKILNELFIQTSEIEAMPAGAERDMQILRIAIIAELDASNLYEKLAQLANDKRVEEVLLDVSQEEKVHFGEFESLLEEIDPEFEEAEEEGKDEVKDIMGI